MAIYTLDQLRAAVPEHYKNFPDDALICLYRRDLKSDVPQGQVFDYLNVEARPIFLSCDQVIQLHSLFLPKSLYVVGLTTLLICIIGLLIYRSLNKIIPTGTKFTLGLKLASIGTFVSVFLLIPNLLRFDVVSALIYTVGWFLITVPLLFLLGFVIQLVKEPGLGEVMHLVSAKINKIMKPRKSKEVWLKISEEMDSGNLDKALWSQCFVKAEGNESKTKSFYMKARYDQLNVGIK
jgi:hypothetical protein